MGRIVTRDFDPDSPRKLTTEQKAKLAALAELPDEAIDYSDIPPLTEKFWANGVRNPYIERARRAARKAG